MIAQFAKSSRTWTVVAACLVLTLGLVALTDAVAAEEPEKQSSEPALRQKTIKMADGTVVATNEYERVEAGGAASDAHAQASLKRLHEAVARRDAARRTLSEQHPQVQALQAEIAQLEAALARIGAAATRPAKISPGELVTVSMDLVGQGVETVKTARVDGDGTINLPYAGEVKAGGLLPRELEKAVAKALQEKGVMLNAIVAVSMPGLGESHQLAKVRNTRAPARGDPAMMEGKPMHAAGMMGVDMMMGPAMTGMEGKMMGMDPAMMGMEGEMMGMPPPQEDPAAKELLGRKLPEVKLDQIPLDEVVDFFRDTLGVNVFVNWRSLEAAGIARDEPVTLRLKDVALRDVLSLMTRGVGQNRMTYKVENGVIVLDAQHTQPVAKQAKLVTEAYDVAHLLGSGTDEQRKGRLNELKEVILTNIQSQGPAFGGGMGGMGAGMSISSFNLRLIVTASEEGHRDVKKLLEMLAREADRPATEPAF